MCSSSYLSCGCGVWQIWSGDSLAVPLKWLGLHLLETHWLCNDTVGVSYNGCDIQIFDSQVQFIHPCHVLLPTADGIFGACVLSTGGGGGGGGGRGEPNIEMNVCACFCVGQVPPPSPPHPFASSHIISGPLWCAFVTWVSTLCEP